MAKPHLLASFLSAAKSVHSTGGGTKETSYYTAINNLLDGAGHQLKPRVRCVMQLKNLGAGNPDGGLFTADQFDRKTGSAKDLGQPSRGVIEVKAPAEPVDDTATTVQITKYWDRYKLVLVTNLLVNRSANLSVEARDYLSTLSLPNPDTDRATAEFIWMHALAIGYSPAYLSDNADGIRENWPRIPLPASREALLASAALGREVAALLDTETPVPGVTSGAVRADLKTIAVVSRVGGGALKPEEFALTAGWGSGGNGKPVMPGVGRVEHNPAGSPTPSLDVYLNATAYWQNVPQSVWDFTIGGYQVMKKWLSYREQRVLGRALTMAEIMEVTAMARRLAALVLLQAALDANYKSVVAATWAFGKAD